MYNVHFRSFISKDFQSFARLYPFRFWAAMFSHFVVQFYRFYMDAHTSKVYFGILWLVWKHRFSKLFNKHTLDAEEFSLTKFKLSSFIKCFLFWALILLERSIFFQLLYNGLSLEFVNPRLKHSHTQTTTTLPI